jgi:hypothetical protein
MSLVYKHFVSMKYILKADTTYDVKQCFITLDKYVAVLLTVSKTNDTEHCLVLISTTRKR